MAKGSSQVSLGEQRLLGTVVGDGCRGACGWNEPQTKTTRNKHNYSSQHPRPKNPPKNLSRLTNGVLPKPKGPNGLCWCRGDLAQWTHLHRWEFGTAREQRIGDCWGASVIWKGKWGRRKELENLLVWWGVSRMVLLGRWLARLFIMCYLWRALFEEQRNISNHWLRLACGWGWFSSCQTRLLVGRVFQMRSPRPDGGAFDAPRMGRSNKRSRSSSHRIVNDNQWP